MRDAPDPSSILNNPRSTAGWKVRGPIWITPKRIAPYLKGMIILATTPDR